MLSHDNVGSSDMAKSPSSVGPLIWAGVIEVDESLERLNVSVNENVLPDILDSFGVGVSSQSSSSVSSPPP